MPRLHTLELYDFGIIIPPSSSLSHNLNSTSSTSTVSAPSSSSSSPPTTVTASTGPTGPALNSLTIIEYTDSDRTCLRHGLWSTIMTWFSSVRDLKLCLLCISQKEGPDGDYCYQFAGRPATDQIELSDLVHQWFGQLSKLLFQCGLKTRSLTLDVDRQSCTPFSRWERIATTILLECEQLWKAHEHLDMLCLMKQRFMGLRSWVRRDGHFLLSTLKPTKQSWTPIIAHFRRLLES